MAMIVKHVSELGPERIKASTVDSTLSAGLKEFLTRVLNAIPNSYASPSLYDAKSYHIGIDGYPYTLGSISTRLERYKDSLEIFYTVRSEHIKNQRGKLHNVRSMSVDKGVANARKFLRRDSIAARANVFMRRVTRAARSTVAQDNRKLSELAESMGFQITGEKQVITTELRALYEGGYHFTTEEFRNNVPKIIQADEERRAAIEELPKSYLFVLVVEQEGRPTKLITLPTGEGDTTAISLAAVATTIVAEHAPDDVLEKLAVLGMVEDHSYLTGVGYKAHEGVYYVAQS